MSEQPNNRKWYNSREIPAEGGREMNFGELILNEPLVKCFASTTPETDSETNYCDAIPDMPWVDVDVARRLERERDEAREALAAIKHYLTKERDDALAQIVQAECRAERFCQERDEAREALENHMAATIHTCHDECKRPMCVLRRERDEAREMQSEFKRIIAGLCDERLRLVFENRRLSQERDEAIRQRDETNTSSKYACDYNYEQKLKAERELAEAREQARRLDGGVGVADEGGGR